MFPNKLKHFRIILASGSPRRQQFFVALELDFEVRLKPIPEKYPNHLKGYEIPIYLAALKASAFVDDLKPDEILITSDTVVWHKNQSLAKPSNDEEAFKMLRTLSGDWHEVITAVCFTTSSKQHVVHYSTKVKFRELTNEEIRHYVNDYQPFDKAGGYGIQEWIGLIGIEEIKGSYFNVMGLPTHLVYETLTNMVS